MRYEMHDFTDLIIQKKYSKLSQDKKVLVDAFLAQIEAKSTYPAVDRRVAIIKAHWIGGDRRRSLTERLLDALAFEPPSPERTPRVMAVAVGSTLVTLVTVLLSAQEHPQMLLLLPAFSAFSVVVLISRQLRLKLAQ